MTFAHLTSPRRTPWLLLVAAALALTACGQAGQTDPASWPNLAADTTTAYVAYGPGVYAVDLETGQERWHFPATPDRDLSFYAAPVVSDDGIVYAGAYDGSVRALDAETGAEVRAFSELNGRIIGSPALVGDLLLIPSDGSRLYAFDRHSGEQQWVATSAGPLWSAPRVDGDTAYVASLAHTLHAVDLATGNEVWPSPPSLSSAIADSPTLQDGVLLAGLLGDSLVAIGASDGAELWRAPSAGWVWGSPVVADGLAYFGDVEGNLYAVDLADGRIVWQDQIDGAITSTPAQFDGHLLIGTDSGRLIAYDPAGPAPLWERTAAGPILGDPVVSDGKVVVAVTSPEALLQAFDAASGTPLWTYLPTPPE